MRLKSLMESWHRNLESEKSVRVLTESRWILTESEYSLNKFQEAHWYWQAVTESEWVFSQFY